MDLEIIVVVGNTFVVFATFLATLYRIKIEREQVKTIQKNHDASECLKSLRKYVKADRGLLNDMEKEELKDFLNYLQTLGEK